MNARHEDDGYDLFICDWDGTATQYEGEKFDKRFLPPLSKEEKLVSNIDRLISQLKDKKMPNLVLPHFKETVQIILKQPKTKFVFNSNREAAFIEAVLLFIEFSQEEVNAIEIYGKEKNEHLDRENRDQAKIKRIMKLAEKNSKGRSFVFEDSPMVTDGCNAKKRSNNINNLYIIQVKPGKFNWSWANFQNEITKSSVEEQKLSSRNSNSQIIELFSESPEGSPKGNGRRLELLSPADIDEIPSGFLKRQMKPGNLLRKLIVKL